MKNLLAFCACVFSIAFVGGGFSVEHQNLGDDDSSVAVTYTLPSVKETFDFFRKMTQPLTEQTTSVPVTAPAVMSEPVFQAEPVSQAEPAPRTEPAFSTATAPVTAPETEPVLLEPPVTQPMPEYSASAETESVESAAPSEHFYRVRYLYSGTQIGAFLNYEYAEAMCRDNQYTGIFDEEGNLLFLNQGTAQVYE
ncbi:MAG: hypothetical protein MJ071_10020 [Oscillospiraceae bacterium]|nr:hypothetical protein [Oscillospiraceae bacterium]